MARYFYSSKETRLLLDYNIEIVNCGLQKKDIAHKEGPIFKYEHIFQYIHDGEGFYNINGKTYLLKAGDMFYLPKNKLLSYSSKPSNPYTYFWVGIDGVNCEDIIKKMNFSVDNPVKHIGDKNLTAQLNNLLSSLEQNDFTGIYKAQGYLYNFIGILLSYNDENNQKLKNISMQYIDVAIDYIKKNYNNDITVTSIAKAIGLGRNYFSVIFHKYVGMPPVEFIMKQKILQACKLLRQNISVTDTALTCGFNSPANFSVQFKRIKGITPIKYKNSK